MARRAAPWPVSARTVSLSEAARRRSAQQALGLLKHGCWPGRWRRANEGAFTTNQARFSRRLSPRHQSGVYAPSSPISSRNSMLIASAPSQRSHGRAPITCPVRAGGSRSLKRGSDGYAELQHEGWSSAHGAAAGTAATSGFARCVGRPIGAWPSVQPYFSSPRLQPPALFDEIGAPAQLASAAI